MIKAIFACDEDWGIGKDNAIPWNDRIDQKWFKESTLGKVVVMGRNTYESLTSPLSLRDNVVISNSLESIPRGFLYSGDIDTAMTQIIERFGSRDIFVIGGSQLFEGVLSHVDEVLINRISGTYDCDVFLNQATVNSNFSSASIDSPEGLNLERYVRN